MQEDRPKAWKPKKNPDSCRNPPLRHADTTEAARVATCRTCPSTTRRCAGSRRPPRRSTARSLLPAAKTGPRREGEAAGGPAGWLPGGARKARRASRPRRRCGRRTPPWAGARRAGSGDPRAPAAAAGAVPTAPVPAPPAVDVDDEAAQLADLRARGLIEEEDPVVAPAVRGAWEEVGAAFAISVEAAIVAMRFTYEILTAIQSYPAPRGAGERGRRARCRQDGLGDLRLLLRPLAPTLHALKAFDEKVRGVRPGKRYRSDLAALLKFIQVQRPRADAPPAPPVSSLQPAGTWRPGRTVAPPAPTAERFAPRIEGAPPAETIAPPPPPRVHRAARHAGGPGHLRPRRRAHLARSRRRRSGSVVQGRAVRRLGRWRALAVRAERVRARLGAQAVHAHARRRRSASRREARSSSSGPDRPEPRRAGRGTLDPPAPRCARACRLPGRSRRARRGRPAPPRSSPGLRARDPTVLWTAPRSAAAAPPRAPPRRRRTASAGVGARQDAVCWG